MRFHLGFIFIFWPCILLAASQTNQLETRKLMSQLAGDLQVIYPLSLDPDAFYDESNRRRVSDFFEQLKKDVEKFRTHMAREESYSFIADSLTKDINEATNWYKRGRPQEASFIVHHLFENCVSCHTKLPSQKSQIVLNLLTEKVKKELSPVRLAKLHVATRQFDQAINLYEKAFLASRDAFLDNYAQGVLTDYLKVTLQVKNNPKHALEFLTKVKSKLALPTFVDHVLEQWIKDLKEIHDNPKWMSAEMSVALQHIENAKMRMNSSFDQSSVVRLIAASSIFEKRLRSEIPQHELAKIYYNLGYIENLLVHSFWLTESRFYLENAIHKNPHSATAKKAYELLEQQVILGYTGSSGIHVPQETQTWLNELRKVAF